MSARRAISDTIGSIPDWLDAVGSLGQALVVGLGAWIAYKGLSTWREQKLIGRRIDLAEEAVRGFVRMKDILFQITNGAVWAAEMAEIFEGYLKDVPENAKRNLVGYAAPLHRINKYHSEISDFLNQRYVNEAYFGEEASKLYRQINQVIVEVQVAADMLVKRRQSGAEDRPDMNGDGELWESLRQKIWMGSNPEHPLNKKVEAVVASAVDLFGAYLRVGKHELTM